MARVGRGHAQRGAGDILQIRVRAHSSVAHRICSNVFIGPAIATDSGVPRASAHRHLRALMNSGLVEKNGALHSCSDAGRARLEGDFSCTAPTDAFRCSLAIYAMDSIGSPPGRFVSGAVVVDRPPIGFSGGYARGSALARTDAAFEIVGRSCVV
jgi:hypothetical protein